MSIIRQLLLSFLLSMADIYFKLNFSLLNSAFGQIVPQVIRQETSMQPLIFDQVGWTNPTKSSLIKQLSFWFGEVTPRIWFWELTLNWHISWYGSACFNEKIFLYSPILLKLFPMAFPTLLSNSVLSGFTYWFLDIFWVVIMLIYLRQQHQTHDSPDTPDINRCFFSILLVSLHLFKIKQTQRLHFWHHIVLNKATLDSFSAPLLSLMLTISCKGVTMLWKACRMEFNALIRELLYWFFKLDGMDSQL